MFTRAYIMAAYAASLPSTAVDPRRLVSGRLLQRGQRPVHGRPVDLGEDEAAALDVRDEIGVGR